MRRSTHVRIHVPARSPRALACCVFINVLRHIRYFGRFRTRCKGAQKRFRCRTACRRPLRLPSAPAHYLAIRQEDSQKAMHAVYSETIISGIAAQGFSIARPKQKMRVHCGIMPGRIRPRQSRPARAPRFQARHRVLHFFTRTSYRSLRRSLRLRTSSGISMTTVGMAKRPLRIAIQNDAYNKSKRGDGLETETSFTTVNFPRMRSFFITGIPYSHSMVAGGLEEMS